MQRLQSFWMRLPVSLRFGLAVVSTVMTILGLPTLADGVAGWAAWLGFVGSTAASYVFPTLGVVGLLIFSSLQLAEIRARRRNHTSGVLADITHREGCPRDPARLETWTQARERDGIEVTVGKCNDCGRMAYRHGDAPIVGLPDPRSGAPDAGNVLAAGPAGDEAPAAAGDATPATADADETSRVTSLAERLAQLYDQGRQLKQLLYLSSAAAAGETVTGQAPRTRISCDGWSRSWDGKVSTALVEHGDASLLTNWMSCASLAAAHPTLRHIEPSTTLGELRAFVDTKLACLKEIVRALGESDRSSTSSPSAVEPKMSPAELLNRALSEAMGLRTRVVLRPDERLPLSEDPLFQWARRTYRLIREQHAAYADDFYGEDPSLGLAYLGLAFGTEIKARGRDGYLERRIELLRMIIRERP